MLVSLFQSGLLNIFHKRILLKNKAYMLQVVFQKKKRKKKRKTISLSRAAFLINIIFICSHEKHNFLAPSLSHGKFSHFFSLPFIFYLLIPSLSLTLVSLLPTSLSLSLSLSMFLFLSITQFSDQIFFFLANRSIVLICKREQICNGNYFIPFYQNPNSLL